MAEKGPKNPKNHKKREIIEVWNWVMYAWKLNTSWPLKICAYIKFKFFFNFKKNVRELCASFQHNWIHLRCILHIYNMQYAYCLYKQYIYIYCLYKQYILVYAYCYILFFYAIRIAVFMIAHCIYAMCNIAYCLYKQYILVYAYCYVLLFYAIRIAAHCI